MLNAGHGAALLRLARYTLEAQFSRRQLPEPEGLDDPELCQRKGVFVTLTKQGQLRGCIGSLLSKELLVDGVRRHTVSAAFHDSRFPPLTKEELPELRIEISVLTKPKPLKYTDGDDLVRRLRPRIDGVILQQPGGIGATFLPQVWKELPVPEIFLEQLCRKAGLPGQSWRSGGLTVKTYQAVRFTEEENDHAGAADLAV